MIHVAHENLPQNSKIENNRLKGNEFKISIALVFNDKLVCLVVFLCQCLILVARAFGGRKMLVSEAANRIIFYTPEPSRPSIPPMPVKAVLATSSKKLVGWRPSLLVTKCIWRIPLCLRNEEKLQRLDAAV